ncbi:MAG: Fic family protein [Bacteroidales bacterium]|nr:Fic family protein [Bacteroidales bacterium]
MTNNKYISQEVLNNKCFSQVINVFHGRQAPEKASLVGYGALIDSLDLAVPIPARLALISEKHRQYQTPDWLVYTPRHMPKDSLNAHLIFAIKYEGINLLFFKILFDRIDSEVIESMVIKEPLSQYSRKIWFLYEWLSQKVLDILDLKEGNYVPLIDEKLQYAISKGINSKRHRILNNLPGTVDFCPLIFKTKKLEGIIKQDLSEKTTKVISNVRRDILLRTSAFLLLKDSKASFNIEGEVPTHTRANRWGKVIGQAGTKPLSVEELGRLQQIVIESNRFVKMGLRREGGFVGEHDPSTGEPIPEHLSARWQDLEILIGGLLKTSILLEETKFNPVLTATIVAFGFVFIHPFVDGNGRIHRYLIHHLLAKSGFTQQGIIFPVSAAILERIDDYRKVLESYSHPILDFIEWKETEDHNVEILNETIDYYRYYDATSQSEFLFECVERTIDDIIPNEVGYLQKYDEMKLWLDNKFEMPDRLVALLIRFLEQNNGKLSKRGREKELEVLSVSEIREIEKKFHLIFLD